jgi:hypothetical protein
MSEGVIGNESGKVSRRLSREERDFYCRRRIDVRLDEEIKKDEQGPEKREKDAATDGAAGDAA